MSSVARLLSPHRACPFPSDVARQPVVGDTDLEKIEWLMDQLANVQGKHMATEEIISRTRDLVTRLYSERRISAPVFEDLVLALGPQ